MTFRLAVLSVALLLWSAALAHEPDAAPGSGAPTHQALPPATKVPTTPASPPRVVGPTASSAGLWCFSASRRAAEASYERELSDAVSTDSLRAFHDALAAHPHRAGTDGDRAVVDYLSATFASMGLEVQTHEIDVYLAKPVTGEVEFIDVSSVEKSPDDDITHSHLGNRRRLAVKEPAVCADHFSADPTLDIGFNAWSGSGEVTAEVVYANYGCKQDFERLKQLGVDVRGKIVIARYGGNYRGDKAKFAEECGAAGLIIYYDPKDVGYAQGLMYPEGGWANKDSIQRGSLLTLEYEGDPLSPGFASVPGAPLLDPKQVRLPTIPVQPLGWGAAETILRNMAGAPVPDDWQGALPFNYRITSGSAVQVRLKVEQVREVTRTASVLGTLRGAKYPDEFIVVGCHHDAWNHGAADPLAGLITVMEAARVMTAAAKAGHPPDRSIVFAAWAAEEYGLMGSTEWVEANLDRLRCKCVAYINLDMAAMGPDFGASSSPSLSRMVIDSSQDVPHCTDAAAPIFAGWSSRSSTLWPQVGTMGGGSDHVGFLCVAGVPCLSMGGGGSPGTSYHTNYDTLAWYRKVVGEDYAPAAMVTRVAMLMLARFANSDVSPIDATRMGEETVEHLREIEKMAARAGMGAAVASLVQRADDLRARAAAAHDAMTRVLDSDALDAADIAAIQGALRSIDRAWLGPGLPGREWYKSRFMAPDRDSGYDSWPLPELRAAVEDNDAVRLALAAQGVQESLDEIIDLVELVRARASVSLTRRTPGGS